MSQYSPPSFDGQHHYAPQWLPDSSNAAIQNGTNFYPINNNPISMGNFSSLPYGTNASTQLPGLGMPNNALPSSSFIPQQFASNEAPTPLYSGFNSSIDALSDSLHPTQRNRFSHPSTVTPVTPLPNQPVTNPPKNALPLPSDDTDLEEGEVSDGIEAEPSHQKIQPLSKSNTPSQTRSKDTLTGDQAALRTNTSSLQSLTPTDPLTHEVPQEMAQKPATIQKQNNQTGSQAGSLAGKSPAQIRIMAQGALLRLAPHNIRFNELAKEDINAAILKKLYDDIGIKVNVAGTKQRENAVSKLDAAKKPIREEPSKPQASLVSETVTTTKKASISNANANAKEAATPDKPLERKDVIARMLAEKAKKKTPNVAVDPASLIQPVSAPSIEKATSDLLVSKTQSTLQSKEKNRAQTELARQRIEQLKKMGLKRQQSQSESLGATQSSSATDENEISKTAVTLHHPLPERPPVINQVLDQPKPSTPQIPGLSISSDNEKIGSPSNIENGAMGTSTPFRNSLGKRPRASDFDELIPEVKKPSVTESRLVIDISEDESLDDDDDVVMSDPSDYAASSQGLKFNGTLPRDTNPRSALSASATPQSRPSDSESLRLKNLEIQAMRRRIAEWEEKNAKKPKSTPALATAVNVASQPLAQVEEIQPITDKAKSTPTPLDKSSSQSLQRSPSIHSLASLDNSDLDRIRQKLLRKREIESGLPALDAELLKFKAKLAEFKREEERLMNEIAKSREERKQLDDELQSLGVETVGLSLEELKAVKEDIERAAAAQDEPEPLDVVTAESTPLSKDSQTATTTVELTQPMEYIPSLEPKSPLIEATLPESVEANDVAEVEDSDSDSSGSSMDESTSSAESSSDDEELESEEQPALPPVSASLNDQLLVEVPQPSIALPAKPDFATAVPVGEPTEERNVSRESSVLSDNYEPPEPEEGSDEAYSPKLSPTGIEDSEMETVPNLPTQSDADITLTRKPQEAVVFASKGDALDNIPNVAKAVSKFSPYQSPLKNFRAYRYHPKFVEDVGDNYRSLTYSHKIDPSQAVCPYEAAGGVCNDATCEFQHWRDMVMPDDKILVEMGNQKEGKTPEEQEAYIAGLKELINNMRRDQVKDFSTVAGEIAAYRRRFLSDSSRILPP